MLCAGVSWGLGETRGDSAKNVSFLEVGFFSKVIFFSKSCFSSVYRFIKSYRKSSFTFFRSCSYYLAKICRFSAV